jgi:exopolysaccharide biosynthesis WecB/TagA/CpsF family protein
VKLTASLKEKGRPKMANLNSINLFDFEVVNDSKENVLASIFNAGKHTISFLNAHCVNLTVKDSIYRWALSKSSEILPDGTGMSLAAKLNGNVIEQNLNGTDLFPSIVEAAAERNLKVYFFGSQPDIARQASLRATEISPELIVAGTRHGFYKPSEEAQIIEEINASGADVLLVALGVPQQEIWIARNRHRLHARIVFGVGAQFDFWSGRISRAPMVLRKTGLEWTWRFALEPRRMFKRYIIGNPIFMCRAVKSAILKKTSFDADRKLRRLLDVCLSGGALLALSPLVAILAFAIKIDTVGPVFFTQNRVGMNGKLFKIYKFRSMYTNAETVRQTLLHHSQRQGICFKSKADPRITRVGKILRRFSLDELPQILNVWKGDMAIVGPRPALPQEVAKFPPKALGRLVAKPGLTGIWQVSGRAEISFDRMINMDLAYSRSRTIMADLAVIGLTFKAILTGRGAY